MEQELISTALATENPNLRAEVCVCVSVCWGGGGGVDSVVVGMWTCVRV